MIYLKINGSMVILGIFKESYFCEWKTYYNFIYN